jgi:hypothetical protein
MPVQRSHYADPGEHRWPVMFCDQHQRLHRGLPFVDVVSALGNLVMWSAASRNVNSLRPPGSPIGSKNC